jgi:3-oxoadipate enol-lactonase
MFFLSCKTGAELSCLPTRTRYLLALAMESLQIDGESFFYKQSGAGPEVVLISGLATDHSMWDVARLSDRFHVTVFDNRGCGRTGLLPGAYSMEVFARDTARICEALKIKRAVFVGHSMGGHIAQHLGASYPDLVQGLVLACSEAKFSIISELATAQQIALMRYDLPWQLLMENYLPLLFGRAFLEDEERRHSYIEALMSRPPAISAEGYEKQVEALRAHDTRLLLPGIQAPVLVLGAEEDLLTPWKCSLELADKIPHAQLVTLRGVGHAAFAENPDGFYSSIRGFLEGICF